MQNFKVTLYEGVTIVAGDDLASAEAWSKLYFGLANFDGISPATDEDVQWVKSMGGAIHQVGRTNPISEVVSNGKTTQAPQAQDGSQPARKERSAERKKRAAVAAKVRQWEKKEKLAKTMLKK